LHRIDALLYHNYTVGIYSIVELEHAKKRKIVWQSMIPVVDIAAMGDTF
jgi:hypothetical protein